MFFVYKNRFLARQIGPVMAFIPDNISVHVHLLDKKTKDGCCQLGFSFSLIFHKNNKSVSAKIITGLSLSILSGRERSKLFQVVVLILEVAITFFLFKLQRQQCASLERCICIDI